MKGIRNCLAVLLLALSALAALACPAALAGTYPVVDVTFFVTKGAGLGVFEKQGGEGLGAMHFKPFTKWPFQHMGESGGYDIYTGSLRSAAEFHYEVGGGDSGLLKQAQKFALQGDSTSASISIDLTPLDRNRREDNGHYQDDLYFNVNDAQHLVMKAGETFNLLPIRVWQAMEGITGNYFIEPDCHAEMMGDNAVSYSHEGSPGLRYIKLEAKSPGVSVLKVTYDPVLLGKSLRGSYIIKGGSGYQYHEADKETYFNAIDPANTGVVVVTVVAGDNYNAANIETNIGMREYDTFYFDGNKADRAEYTFKPFADGGISVRVHRPLHEDGVAWGNGWSDGRPNPDGSFTADLYHGRNIIEVSAGSSGFKQYHVVTAKGIGITAENKSNPSWGVNDALSAGDEVEISFTGIKTPLEKIAGIYNPGFPDTCYVLYESHGGEQVRSVGTQYDLSAEAKNRLSVTVPLSRRIDLVSGAINCGGYGSAPGGHRITVGVSVPANGDGGNAPYTNAALYSAMPDITLGGFATAPRNVIAAGSDGEITLVWQAPLGTGGSGITGYDVSNGGEIWIPLAADTYSYTFEGLENSVGYSLYVRARNSAGEGTYAAAVASPYAADATPPGAPGNFSVTPGYGSASLAWEAPADNGGAFVTGYQVSMDGENWTAVPAPDLAYVFGNLADGAYTFYVRAVNAKGVGQYAVCEAEISPATNFDAPGRPEGFTAIPGDGEVSLSWRAPSGDGGSEIIKYQVSKGDSVWVDVDAGVFAYRFGGLTNSIGYTFSVRAVNEYGPGEAASAAATPHSGNTPGDDGSGGGGCGSGAAWGLGALILAGSALLGMLRKAQDKFI